MRNPWHIVNGPPQTPLFRLAASAVTLQALIDHDSGSLVFGVQTVDPINDQLCALWSSAPIELERYLKGLHEAHSEFLSQLWDAAGPFS
jgi:hypothetical protein